MKRVRFGYTDLNGNEMNLDIECVHVQYEIEYNVLYITDYLGYVTRYHNLLYIEVY